MKERITTVILAIALAQLTRADSTVQEVQQELKEQGYYFGQINGEKDADTIAAQLGDFAVYDRARDMKDAVALSFQAAKPGDTVLLAPACASFDMFESFEHRGKVFKDEVLELKSKVQSRSLSEPPA